MQIEVLERRQRTYTQDEIEDYLFTSHPDIAQFIANSIIKSEETRNLRHPPNILQSIIFLLSKYDCIYFINDPASEQLKFGIPLNTVQREELDSGMLIKYKSNECSLSGLVIDPSTPFIQLEIPPNTMPTDLGYQHLNILEIKKHFDALFGSSLIEINTSQSNNLFHQVDLDSGTIYVFDLPLKDNLEVIKALYTLTYTLEHRAISLQMPIQDEEQLSIDLAEPMLMNSTLKEFFNKVGLKEVANSSIIRLLGNNNLLELYLDFTDGKDISSDLASNIVASRYTNEIADEIVDRIVFVRKYGQIEYNKLGIQTIEKNLNYFGNIGIGVKLRDLLPPEIAEVVGIMSKEFKAVYLVKAWSDIVRRLMSGSDERSKRYYFSLLSDYFKDIDINGYVRDSDGDAIICYHTYLTCTTRTSELIDKLHDYAIEGDFPICRICGDRLEILEKDVIAYNEIQRNFIGADRTAEFKLLRGEVSEVLYNVTHGITITNRNVLVDDVAAILLPFIDDIDIIIERNKSLPDSEKSKIRRLYCHIYAMVSIAKLSNTTSGDSKIVESEFTDLNITECVRFIEKYIRNNFTYVVEKNRSVLGDKMLGLAIVNAYKRINISLAPNLDLDIEDTSYPPPLDLGKIKSIYDDESFYGLLGYALTDAALKLSRSKTVDDLKVFQHDTELQTYLDDLVTNVIFTCIDTLPVLEIVPVSKYKLFYFLCPKLVKSRQSKISDHYYGEDEMQADSKHVFDGLQCKYCSTMIGCLPDEISDKMLLDVIPSDFEPLDLTVGITPSQDQDLYYANGSAYITSWVPRSDLVTKLSEYYSRINLSKRDKMFNWLSNLGCEETFTYDEMYKGGDPTRAQRETLLLDYIGYLTIEIKKIDACAGLLHNLTDIQDIVRYLETFNNIVDRSAVYHDYVLRMLDVTHMHNSEIVRGLIKMSDAYSRLTEDQLAKVKSKNRIVLTNVDESFVSEVE